HPLNSLGDYIYVVICSFYKDKIILSRQKKKQTWETQGGHIEAGETPMETAKRELFEESGIRNAEIIPICDYYGYDADSHANGMVFAAIVHEMGDLPDSEMAEVKAFIHMPEELSYPMVTPLLFEESRKRIEGLVNESPRSPYENLNQCMPDWHEL
ncbi:MAG: NUDIX domain-containing protein, partial [Clostridiales bacterium]|nr:NUDIX domain-containing protein [Clostridiales bacterium]